MVSDPNECGWCGFDECKCENADEPAELTDPCGDIASYTGVPVEPAPPVPASEPAVESALSYGEQLSVTLKEEIREKEKAERRARHEAEMAERRRIAERDRRYEQGRVQPAGWCGSQSESLLGLYSLVG